MIPSRLFSLLPVSISLTFLLTLVICSFQQHADSDNSTPNISELGTEAGHPYFAAGFTLIALQCSGLFFVYGQQLKSTKPSWMPDWIIPYAFIFAYSALPFLLLMAFVAVDVNSSLHLTGAFGTFALLCIFLAFYTVIALIQHRNPGNRAVWHSGWMIFILVTLTILTIVCAFIWMSTANSFAEYAASSSPFLLFLTWIPGLWSAPINQQTWANERIPLHSESSSRYGTQHASSYSNLA